ncbi:related to ankyrin 1 [Cephalotrichum gorgonifer]|uniref:Related to ankyrin 1 n=1 Tax=Cephalotrichum gorgonifer TaxID=2041049 RepID=A0AAE8SY57_9PEZI|nr:related to ankyrin 1 [Cephalotrichum gorgonifer]
MSDSGSSSSGSDSISAQGDDPLESGLEPQSPAFPRDKTPSVADPNPSGDTEDKSSTTDAPDADNGSYGGPREDEGPMHVAWKSYFESREGDDSTSFLNVDFVVVHGVYGSRYEYETGHGSGSSTWVRSGGPEPQLLEGNLGNVPGFAITEVNGLFIDSKVLLRTTIISIHAWDRSYEHDINLAFDSYCSTLGVPFEIRIFSDDDEYSAIGEDLSGLEDGLKAAVDEDHLQRERTLLSLASPVHSLKTIDWTPNFLTEAAQYQSWLKLSGPQILYIHGTDRVSEAAGKAFYDLDTIAGKEGTRTLVLYFSFDRWDVRRDSIRDMLSTFMAQTICHYPRVSNWVSELFARLDHERGWTEADLVYWFERFRFTNEYDHVMCVINNFDECTKGSRKPFLESFARVAGTSEHPWRVIITSHEPGALLDELPASATTILDLTTLELDDSGTGVDAAWEPLVKLRPDLLSSEKLVREQLGGIGNVEPLARHIISEQVRVRPEWPEDVSILELFGRLEPAPGTDRDDQLLEHILEKVFREIDDQATVRQILTWVLYCVRPLTVRELATVTWLGSKYDRQNHSYPSSSAIENLASKIQTWFAGIIVIEQNEIIVQDPRLRNILMGKGSGKPAPGASQYLWQEVQETAHLEITKLCLDYLARNSVQEQVDLMFNLTDLETSEVPTFTDRDNLCSYALQAWPHHFLLSCSSLELTSVVSQLTSSKIARGLARGYWALSNRVTRSAKCLESLFPIFAGFGLLDVVDPVDNADARLGLLEAASKGQSKTVWHLLKRFDISQETLMDVLVAAAASGDEDMLLGLVKGIIAAHDNPSKIAWPPVLISRASWLGLDRFAEKILELGCPPDPDVAWMSTLHSSPLGWAGRNGHAATVRTLLKHKADVNFRGITGRTPLHFASCQGNPEIVKILVQEGKADLEAADDNDDRPAYFPSLWGRPQVLEALLDMGADPDMGIAPDSTVGRWSPLVTAIDDGFEQCARLLLDNKANANIVGPHGDCGTALRYAAVKGHVDICRMLLEAGADPNSSLMGRPILLQTIENYQSTTDHQLEVLDLLLAHGVDVNTKDANGVPALIQAVKYSQDDVLVRYLLDHGADVNIRDRDNDSALHQAALSGKYSVVELLLERNIEVNAVNASDTTPLYDAVPNPDILQMLLEKGADPDLGKGNGFTALMYAAWYDHIHAMELLLEHNATVDLEFDHGDNDSEYMGWTALSFALSYGSADTVRILAKNGADLKHKSAAGVPAIHMAVSQATLSALLEFFPRIDLDEVDSDGSTALHKAARSTYDSINIERLVNAGSDLDVRTTLRGDTPLSLAAFSENVEGVKYLVNHGADVNRGSPFDGSPLHQASRRLNLNIVEFLLKKGADVNQTCYGMAGTPLQAAFLTIRPNYSPWTIEQVVECLLQHGADATAEAGLLSFPINAAALGGTPSLINLLLGKGATVNVRDVMGRMPVHFSAFQGKENLQEVVDTGGDIRSRDKMGRTALHWAAQRGQVQAVEMIIKLLGGKGAVDVLDEDGWTPLCWAARGKASFLDDPVYGEDGDQIEVMKLLIENGASRRIKASVGAQKWTPLRIARFSGQSSSVIELLSGDLDDLGGTGQELGRNGCNATAEGGAEEDQSKKANDDRVFTICDACLCGIRGFAYKCKTCVDFWFCFKCYPHRRILHSPPDHVFEELGPEFAPGGSEDDDASSVSSASSSSSSEG